MRVALLGVRGSVPVCEEDTAVVGGATSAISVARDGEPPSLVLDAGTGLRRWPVLHGPAPFRGIVLLTHLHWDHVIGLPFWPAGDHAGANVRLLLPRQDGISARGIMERLMSPPLFPITPSQLRGEWTIEDCDEGEVTLDGWTVVAREIPHKGGRTFGYRISDGHSALAYLPDHAPQSLGDGPDGVGLLHEAALALADGVDLLIHDAQYSRAELPQRGHLGHSAAEYAVLLGAAAGAAQVLFFHHDPGRSDAGVDRLASQARLAAPVPALVARDGMVLQLPIAG